MAFLHGVSILELSSGPVPVSVVPTAVIGLIGTAPTWAVSPSNPVQPSAPNTPTLVSSLRDASQFGPLMQGYTIPYALAQIQEQGHGQVIVINVFDPTVHQSEVVNEAHSVPAAAPLAINLQHMGILAGSVAVNPSNAVQDWPNHIAVTLGQLTKPTVGNTGGYVFKCTSSGTTGSSEPSAWNQVVGGTTVDGGATWTNIGKNAFVETIDWVMDYINGVISIPTGSKITAAEALKISYNYADPTAVEDSAILGAITDGVYTGLTALQTTYQTMGFVAKLLIAPGFSNDAGVATALQAMAHMLRALALIDSDPLTQVSSALANRGQSGAPFDTSDDRTILCFPQEQYFDAGLVPTGVTLSRAGLPLTAVANAINVFPFSPFVAGVIAATDFTDGVWFSPSNREVLGPLGPDVAIYSSSFDPTSDTNQLSAAGIVTIFNGWADGQRIWGNRLASFPSATDPSTFISVRRMMDMIEDTIIRTMLQFLDRPITNGLITSITATVNMWFRSLVGQGGLFPGSVCTFDPANNPPTSVAAGQLTFNVVIMPPPPAERLTFDVSIDTDLLKGLTSNTSGAAATTVTA